MTGADFPTSYPHGGELAPSVGSGGSFVCLHRHDTTEPSQCSCTASASSPPCRPCRRRLRRRRPRHDHRPPRHNQRRPHASDRRQPGGHTAPPAAAPAADPRRRWRWSRGVTEPTPPSAPPAMAPPTRAPASAPPQQVTVAVATESSPAPRYRIQVRNVGNSPVETTVRQELPPGSSTTAISGGGRSTPAGGSSHRGDLAVAAARAQHHHAGHRARRDRAGPAADRADLRVHQRRQPAVRLRDGHLAGGGGTGGRGDRGAAVAAATRCCSPAWRSCC